MKLHFKLNRRVKTIITHISAWGLAVIASLLEISDYDIKLNLDKVNLPIWISYMIVFYISYLLLTPKLLFKKRNVMYVVLSTIMLSASFIGLKSWYQLMRAQEFEEFMSKTMANTSSRKYYNPKESGKYKDDFHKYFDQPRKGFEEELRMRETIIERMFHPNNFNPFSPRNVGIVYGILFIFSLSIINSSLSFELTNKKLVKSSQLINIKGYYIFNKNDRKRT